jgi:hypothetical protein
LAVITALFAAGQMKMLAQRIKQAGPGIEVEGVRLPIHLERHLAEGHIIPCRLSGGDSWKPARNRDGGCSGQKRPAPHLNRFDRVHIALLRWAEVAAFVGTYFT